jgi:hypothetical protein
VNEEALAHWGQLGNKNKILYKVWRHIEEWSNSPPFLDLGAR